MTDESKPLIVEGEEVGEYSDSHFYFGKWCMATVELWTSPKEFDAYQYDWETFKEFYKEETDEYKYVDCEDEEFTPGMGTDTNDIEKWLLEFCENTSWIEDEFYFIVHWRRYASYTKEVYEDGQEEWCLEDMGESSPDRYCYKNGKIEEGWSTPMEEEE
tara:strand:- start:230 stop:706 length:477 start_codon:yes stop_codon:yes gene_type:complete